jgi:TolB protein
LTNHPGIDYAPAWSPTGRKIVFVSTRSGDSDIWLADLDKIDDRFINISQYLGTSDTFPAWSPDGNSLAWASTAKGLQDIYIYNIVDDQAQPHILGTGNRPVWSPDGDTLFTSLLTPNRTYLTGYSTDSDGLALPPIPLSGSLAGLSWSHYNLPDPLPASLAKIVEAKPTPSWHVALENNDGIPGGRRLVVPILDVEAPYPMLQDMADESFIALREALATRIGWDYLSTLENAYVPLTSLLSPGMLEDWLYTGRAFTLNPVVINAGWMVVMREDLGAETYWRVYLRARFQDGSQGKPLYNIPWDLNARYSGDPRTYEQGGAPMSSIPPGYWLDFTQLAASYGWQRLPALSTWRSAIPSARYNEFVLTDGLDWHAAMLEIYPPEALTSPETTSHQNNIISVR